MFTKQTARRPPKGRPKNASFLSLVTLTLDLWPWPSNSSERETTHFFRVNLAQIRSAVPEILTQTNGAKNRTFRRSLRAAKIADFVSPLITLVWIYLYVSAADYMDGTTSKLTQIDFARLWPSTKYIPTIGQWTCNMIEANVSHTHILIS